MSKLFVVAALAACALAYPFLGLAPNMFQIRDGEYVLTPRELPCSYEIKVSQDAVCDGQPFGKAECNFYVHDSYFKAHAEGHVTFAGMEEDVEKEFLLRSDLKGSENGTVVVFDSVKEKDRDACFNETVTEEERAELVKDYLELFVTNTTWSEKSTEIFDEKNCSVYSKVNDTARTTVKVYVDDTNTVVGAKVTMYVPIPQPTSSSSSAPAPTSSSAPAPTSSSAPAPTSSSAPAPTSSSAPAPTSSSAPAPTSSSAPAPTSSSAPAPASSSAPAPASSSAPAPASSSSAKYDARDESSKAPSASSATPASSSATPASSSATPASSSATPASSSATPASSSATPASSSAAPTERKIEITAHVTYGQNYAPLNRFVISKDVSDKCNDMAYHEPTVELCAVPSSYVSSSSVAPTPTPSQQSSASTTVVAVAMTLLCVVAALI